MPFVQHGRQDYKSDGSHSGFRAFTIFVPEASVRENSQDEIFRDVAEFANREMPEIDLLGRQGREKVRQCGNNDLGGLV